MADTRLIPDGINDSSSQAFNELFDLLGSIDITPLLVYLIDNTESSALIHLAEQFSVTGYEGWNFVSTDFEKRKLVKEAILNHKYKGTKYGIIQALRSIGFESQIKEWFEYSAEPYHFKLTIISASQDIDLVNQEKMSLLIEEYKNVRSVLDTVEIDMPAVSNTPFAGGCSTAGIYMVIGG
ncbi:MAG: phage tail protein I [Candidatus Gastranaerophilales bacterium]|nr:phage tail protein I [Candidatus Gastranaerophilales bacterium]